MTDICQVADTLQSTPGVQRVLLAPFDHETLAARPAVFKQTYLAHMTANDA